jgi:acyl dehydratase
MSTDRPVTLTFTRQPPAWRAYARALLARRPALVPQGRTVPAIDARASGLTAPPRRLAAYRAVCELPADGALPLAYPHVLAMPLRLALLTCDAFPVRLLGLVHLRERIVRRRAIADDEPLDLRCGVSGLRETERGQEIDLLTEARAGGSVVWSETSTLLARRRGARPPRPSARTDGPPADAAVARWRVPAGIGRRYASVSGDLNPIHLGRTTARWFGFDRAIAHGMWSLSRAVAALGARVPAGAVELDARFKVPILVPAEVTLRHWSTPDGVEFVLQDAAGERPHVVGRLGAPEGP